MGVVDARGFEHHRVRKLSLLPDLQISRHMARNGESCAAAAVCLRPVVYEIAASRTTCRHPLAFAERCSVATEGERGIWACVPALYRRGNGAGRMRHHDSRIDNRIRAAGHHLLWVHSGAIECDQSEADPFDSARPCRVWRWARCYGVVRLLCDEKCATDTSSLAGAIASWTHGFWLRNWDSLSDGLHERLASCSGMDRGDHLYRGHRVHSACFAKGRGGRPGAGGGD